MITTEQVISLLKIKKPDLTDRPFSKLLIEKYYEQLITDTDFITQSIVEASENTDNTDELINYIANDYITTAAEFEIMNITREMKKPVKLKV